MKQAELLDQALAKAGISQRELAKRWSLHHSEIVRIRQGDRKLTFAEAADLANLANLDAIATAARIREHSEKSKTLRELMHRIAGGAALLLLYTTSNCAQVHNITNVSFDISAAEYTYAPK